eukprot:CAMPEP_0176012086 /NCGR_PEP_ID=MMETSP0120_2-20121206/5615_1 /TAXON_ID=160619 /ORGANISM="Kryptoperidinium foliaceum, Strain CCMP 1326" /LENGTH=88 /DNA_ID=CAMNT_0017344963 /DNA_START=377 /DNA_END=643 /DNA_ORIENTATION=-
MMDAILKRLARSATKKEYRNMIMREPSVTDKINMIIAVWTTTAMEDTSSTTRLFDALRSNMCRRFDQTVKDVVMPSITIEISVDVTAS